MAPRADCVTVYGGATRYLSRVTALNGITLASGNVFGDNTAARLAAETIALSDNITNGYTGAVTVGVPLS